ncbi:P-loop ATPase, Sll1717 family [Micromonospora globbae]|uniref:P-loop ATPase, Sll1717 family n=1 Tax=Micromonospora globbae TaxID=1894969 RepID=UPI003447E8A0
MKPAYRDLYFGMSDARNEVTADESSFIKSYVDLNNASQALVNGRKFLVLGPKGTGKSALAWYLRATEREGSHLVHVRDATTLPLAEVPRVQTGQVAGPERTVVAWKFILLCNYLELLLRDKDCTLQFDKEVQRVAKLLRDFGFMGDASGRALLSASSTTIQIPLPKLGTIYKRESKPSLNIYSIVPYMESWVSQALSSSRHVLLVDGLDSIFLNDEKYDESLASLVQAAYSVNQKLMSSEASGSIVLLLRNDAFSRIALSLPDSQKMRDDLAFDLDWRVLSGAAGVNAPLIQLANQKAAKALEVDSVRVLEYFPPKIIVGKRGPGQSIGTLKYLLNMTRHTPRDLLRLFEEIRKVEASGIYGSEPQEHLDQDVIREGVLQYSSKYFVGAISNEFAGAEGGPESAAAAISALKVLDKQQFNAKEFTAALEDLGHATINAEKLLTLLFYAGAVGNMAAGRSESYMHFYHRRDDSEVYLKGSFILHNALVHAWNVHRGA